MEPNPTSAEQQLVLAFRSLQRAVDKTLMSGMIDGAAATAALSYQRLQARAAAQWPEDFYLTDVLVYTPQDGATDYEVLVQLSLLTNQVVDYLEGLVRAREKARYAASFEELGDMGRDLQEQIVNITRTTLRRALSGIDVSIEMGESRKHHRKHGRQDEGESTVTDASADSADKPKNEESSAPDETVV